VESSISGARSVSLPAECLHHLVEAQADRSPHADAVVLEDKRLSYQQLDRRAGHLAHELRLRGVAPEVVGVYLDCSLAMVIGVLALLKAGVPTCRWIPSTRTWEPT
jgi:non-ribosomal peptide synthetase component F